MVEMRPALASSSPASQGGTSTNTPATRITASAPHTVFNNKTDGNDADLAEAFCGLTIDAERAQSDDPFLDPASAARGSTTTSGLSPVASTFTPGASAFSGLPGTAQNNYNAGPATLRRDTGHATEFATSTCRNNGPAARRTFRDSLPVFSYGTFTEEDLSQRAIVIESEFPLTNRIGRMIQDAGVHDFKIEGLPSMQGKSKCLLTFKNPAIAAQAFSSLNDNLERCTIISMKPKGVAHSRDRDATRISRYEGELKLVFVMSPGHQNIPEAVINEDLVMCMITQFGPIKAVKRLPNDSDLRKYRFEFADTDSMQSALACTHGIKTNYGLILVDLYQPDITDPNWPDYRIPESEPWSGYTITAGRRPQASLTGRSVLPAGVAANTNAYGQLFRPDARRRTMNDNHIDTVAIENGEDCRTTIMLRNIPNRVDIHMLKDIIDITSKGKYDFIYLRIDFQNRCNVGYAFINFSDALSIIPFAEARQGIRWEVFDSDKVAELSYATIQNRENLIQKFRNSSVMLENPDYRPKLYYSDPHPRSGMEEPFPEPDNIQKMRRSMENAETIGLFRPDRRRGPNYTAPMPFRPGRAERRGRPGVYMAPARVARLAQAPHSYTTARPRASYPLRPVYTPPESPTENMDPHSTVRIGSPEDAFFNMDIIRDARRRGRPNSFHCETQPHEHFT